MDEMLTIEPRPAFAISAPTTWQQIIVPLTFTSITRSHDASGYVSNGPFSSTGASGGESSAAAFTRPAGTPSVDTTTASALSTDARSVTSTCSASGSPPGYGAAMSNTATRAP